MQTIQKQIVAPVHCVDRSLMRWPISLVLTFFMMTFDFTSLANAQSETDPQIVRPSGYHVQLNGSNVSPIHSTNTNTPVNNPSNPSSFPASGYQSQPSSAVGLSSAAQATHKTLAKTIENAASSSAPVQSASWTTPSSTPISLSGNNTNNTASNDDKSNSRLSSLEIKAPSKGLVGGVERPKTTWAAAFSMMLSLAIVLCLFLIVAWIFKKSQPPSFTKLPGAVVQVMGRSPMAPRQQMYVVRFGSKLLLVSHQNGQTQTLSEITDIDEVTRLTGLCEANAPTSITHSFRDVFRQVASGKLTREAA